MTGTMRAAVLTGPGRMEIREVERPHPAPGEVRIRLEGCGVCASNLVPWSGPEWMQFPTAPGALGAVISMLHPLYVGPKSMNRPIAMPRAAASVEAKRARRTIYGVCARR